MGGAYSRKSKLGAGVLMAVMYYGYEALSMGGAYSTKSKLGGGVLMTVVYYEAMCVCVWGGGGGLSYSTRINRRF